jgi:hypothetical protein
LLISSANTLQLQRLLILDESFYIPVSFQVAYIIVDEMHHDNPQLLKDQYWEEIVPPELPHTVASEQFRMEPPTSSTANVFVTEDEGEIISPPSVLSLNKSNPSDPIGTPGMRKRGSISSRRQRYNSTRSNQSDQSQAPRKGSSSGKFSMFKRLVSREPSSKLSVGEIGGSGEVFGSTMNVGDAIPELDENLVTVVSTRRDEVRKPTVQEIFRRAEENDAESQHSLPRLPTSFDAMTVECQGQNEEEHLLTDFKNGKPEIQETNKT